MAMCVTSIFDLTEPTQIAVFDANLRALRSYPKPSDRRFGQWLSILSV
jgi:hypothetical protein